MSGLGWAGLAGWLAGRVVAAPGGVGRGLAACAAALDVLWYGLKSCGGPGEQWRAQGGWCRAWQHRVGSGSARPHASVSLVATLPALRAHLGPADSEKKEEPAKEEEEVKDGERRQGQACSLWVQSVGRSVGVRARLVVQLSL